ncbi:molecular chaperone [Escherichia coli]|nr:molecular chaperone [Escherichia coli]
MTAFRAAFKAYRMHQVLLLPRFARLTIALGLATAVFPVDAEYYFNPRFLSNEVRHFSVPVAKVTGTRHAATSKYHLD